MSKSSAPMELRASETKVDISEGNQSAEAPQQTVNNEKSDMRDSSDTEGTVEGGSAAKAKTNSLEERNGQAKADDSDQNEDISKPTTEQPQHSTSLDADNVLNVVKPVDASNSPEATVDAPNSPKPALDASNSPEATPDSSNLSRPALDPPNSPKSAVHAKKLDTTDEKDKEISSSRNETLSESKVCDPISNSVSDSKESEDTRPQRQNEAASDHLKDETQDESGATSKIERRRPIDTMDIDTKSVATEADELVREGVKEAENENSSKENEERTDTGVEEMEIDSKRVDDDANAQKTGNAKKEPPGVRKEAEAPNTSDDAGNLSSKDTLPEQVGEHDTEQGKGPQRQTEAEPTKDETVDEKDDSKKEANESKGKDEEMSVQTNASIPKEEESTVRDSGENQISSGRPRRSSARNPYEPRSLRPRTSGRVNNSGSTSESPKEDTASQKPRAVSGSSRAKSASFPNSGEEGLNEVDDESTPRPTMEANGLVMRIEEAVFVTMDQLDELKIARLTDKKVKPFEELTFQDLRTYNRDQLRAYCFAYGMARRKKTEMEADMARYLSYWNKGREGFALHEYVPTSSRVIERVEPNPADSITTLRATTSVGSVSQDGTTTPSTSNGKAPGFGLKIPSNRAATPSKGTTTAANSVRLSANQGSSAPSGGGTVGVTSTGNTMQPGSSQTGAHRITTTGSRTTKAGTAVPVLPRGFGTSFKQKVHARHAGAKFKAAYNGAGPAIVNIVENAAAYFEGKDSPEVILDQAKSYERYQFNVDMLNEIFDGVPEDSEESDGDVVMGENDENGPAVTAAKDDNLPKTNTADSPNDVIGAVALRVANGKRKAQALELTVLEEQFRETEERTKHTERTNMRLFQRLERAETKEQVEAVKREFEAVHRIIFDESIPPPLVRRKLDKTLSPIVMSDDKCRILRFKVS